MGDGDMQKYELDIAISLYDHTLTIFSLNTFETKLSLIKIRWQQLCTETSQPLTWKIKKDDIRMTENIMPAQILLNDFARNYDTP